MKLLIILTFCLIFTLGFIILYKTSRKNKNKFDFANEFRSRFINLTNHYFSTYDNWNRKGEIDHQEYFWLTKNVNTMQGNLGKTGVMHYMAPFQSYQIPHYQIVINTLPKLRDNTVVEFDINASDDALIRHLGILEELIIVNNAELKNPFKWFQIGFHKIMSLPLMILNWFGIIGNNTLYTIMANTIYKFFSGIIGLVTFVSGIVTIIQGKEAVINLLDKIVW